MAPVTFAAFALPGFRSAFICSSTNVARSSVSFAQDHPLSDWSISVGSIKLGWAHLASIMAHLLLKSSAFFPVFEIELAFPAVMKFAHPEAWPSLMRRKKKWRRRATYGITPTYASQ